MSEYSVNARFVCCVVVVFAVFLSLGIIFGCAPASAGEQREYVAQYVYAITPEPGIRCWVFHVGYAGGISCLKYP